MAVRLLREGNVLYLDTDQQLTEHQIRLAFPKQWKSVKRVLVQIAVDSCEVCSVYLDNHMHFGYEPRAVVSVSRIDTVTKVTDRVEYSNVPRASIVNKVTNVDYPQVELQSLSPEVAAVLLFYAYNNVSKAYSLDGPALRVYTDVRCTNFVKCGSGLTAVVPRQRVVSGEAEVFGRNPLELIDSRIDRHTLGYEVSRWPKSAFYWG